MNEAFPSRRSHTATGRRIACLDSLRDCFLFVKRQETDGIRARQWMCILSNNGEQKGKHRGEIQAQKERNHGEIRSGRHVSEALSG